MAPLSPSSFLPTPNSALVLGVPRPQQLQNMSPSFTPLAPLLNSDTVISSCHGTPSLTIPTWATCGLNKFCSLRQHCNPHLLPSSPCPHSTASPSSEYEAPGPPDLQPKPSLTTTLLPQAALEAPSLSSPKTLSPQMLVTLNTKGPCHCLPGPLNRAATST